MDLEKYLDKYNNVSREEAEKIRSCGSFLACNDFEWEIKSLHESREKEERDGRPSLQSGPLVHVHSVVVQPEKDDGKPLAIYGRICAEFRDSIYGEVAMHEIYKRERDDAEVIGVRGNLTLNGPDVSCWPYHACIPFSTSKINIQLFDGANNLFVQECFSLDDTDFQDDFERVKSILIHSGRGSITLHYIAIPLGVHCRIEVMFYKREGSKTGGDEHRFVNVNGKIVARYCNTYGNYAGEECTIFEKKENDFQRVNVDLIKPMELTRCWVTLPAYSSLLVSMDLSEFGSGRKFVNETAQFLAQPGLMFGDSFLLDDILVQVRVAWFAPTPQGVSSNQHEKCSPPRGIPRKEIDIEEEDESSTSSDGSDDEARSNPRWTLHPHKNKPLPSAAVEIFSVSIGREKSQAVQIYGSIEVLFDDIAICVFKRGEKDALRLSENVTFMPILDGSRVYEECTPLQMKFDIRDVEGRLAIKGYVDWAASVLESNLWRDKQLSSIIQGKHGFATVHYSIFSRAVEANIKVFFELEMGSPALYPKVHGSLTTQYSYYDYSSRYNRDHYQSVLFRRAQDDSIQVNADQAIPLSRSRVVVPSYSSLTIDVDLSTGVSGQMVCCSREIMIGESSKIIETHYCVVRIEIEWCEVK